jgi:glucose/arabinose dehydrogenase
MHNIVRTTAAAIVMLAGAGAVRAAAEDGSGTLLKGKAAFGSWRQDKPGLRRLIKPQDLPPVGKSTPNFSEVAPVPPGTKPRVPPGFLVEIVASGYVGPRAIRVAPNGDLFVADSASDIAFTRDGKRLLLSVGSGSNVALDMFPEPEVKGGLQA